MGLQSFCHGVEYAAMADRNSTNDRLTRLENMMEKLLTDRTFKITDHLCLLLFRPE